MSGNNKGWRVRGAFKDVQTAKRDPRPAEAQRIVGVLLREYHPVQTGYGSLREMLRSEWLGENSTVDQVFVASMRPGMVSAWHAHKTSTDRLFVAAGTMLIVIYDNRPDSPSCGVVQEFRLSAGRSSLLIVPPRLWHGAKNIGEDSAELMNAADIGYCYETPDHWRVPAESDAIPYRFA